MKYLILLVIIQVTCAAVNLNKRGDCGLVCPMYFSPVCGSDGKTYNNACFMRIAICNDPSILQIHNGACDETVVKRKTVRQSCHNMMCIAIYDPVCGSDGKTYSSECVLNTQTCGSQPAITVAHKGPCGHH